MEMTAKQPKPLWLRPIVLGLVLVAVASSFALSSCDPLQTCDHEAWSKITMLYTGGVYHITGGEVREQGAWWSDGHESCWFNSVYGMHQTGGSNGNYCYWNPSPPGGNTTNDDCTYAIGDHSPVQLHFETRGDFRWFDILSPSTQGTYILKPWLSISDSSYNVSIACNWSWAVHKPYTGDYDLNCSGAQLG
jgi:hypothetical protein